MTVTYSDRLEVFRTTLENKLREYYSNKFNRCDLPSVQIKSGRKFDKVILVENRSRRSYCWVNKETGGLLKGNWKKVEDHRERGNIFNDDVLKGCNPYGLDYLNMANYTF